VLALMRRRLCPVLVETYRGRPPSALNAPPPAHPAEVTLALRERGWVPYRIWLDQDAEVWIAKVIDWAKPLNENA
jgi:hypothetical protein